MSISLSPDVERLIADQVRNGRYHSADEVVREGLELLLEREKREHGAPSSGVSANGTLNFASAFEDIAQDPDTDWARVPRDLSKTVDHYLYGGQKTP